MNTNESALGASSANRSLQTVGAPEALLEPLLRRSEWVLVFYFIYTGFLAVYFSLPSAQCVAAFAIPTLLIVLAFVHRLHPNFAASVARDWLAPPLILLAYWQVEWFYNSTYLRDLERSWLVWDHTILYRYKLHSIAESAGSLIPAILEVCYTLVYAIPPFCIAALYICNRRQRVDAFLFPFLMGILFTYALLPFFPSASPRLEFPGQDLPTFLTIWRKFNIWILDRGDIHTSVFPSGHVATAFAGAFAMLRALPNKKWLVRGLFLEALLVTAATIYGRYHYAADCLAAFTLSLAAIAIAALWDRWPHIYSLLRRWRAVVGIAAIVLLTAKTAQSGITLQQQRPPVTFTVRLETDISTYSSRPGDPIRAIVIANVLDGDRIVMPQSSILFGQVRKVTRIGRGFIHERASLKLEFNEWQQPSGERHHLTSRITDVDNAREDIAADGHIHGILAAGGAPGFLLGMWSRPDTVVLARTAAGFAGVSRFLCQRAQFSPAMMAGVIALRFVAVPWPDAEIHLPPGTEFIVSAAVPIVNDQPENRISLPEPPSEVLIAVAASQPLFTTRGASLKTADLTNLLFLGSRQQIVEAFTAAGWWPAEPLTHRSALAVYKAISAQRGYPTAPMSALLLEGRLPDLNFQKTFNTVAKRHHIRIWQQPGQLDGRDIWIGAATHDVAMRFRESGNTFTHRIDPMVDRERAKIIDALTFQGCSEKIQMVDRTITLKPLGRDLVTDGRLAAITLKQCEATAFEGTEIHPRQQRTAGGRFVSRLVLEGRYAVLRGNVYYWTYRAVRRALAPSVTKESVNNSLTPSTRFPLLLVTPPI